MNTTISQTNKTFNKTLVRDCMREEEKTMCLRIHKYLVGLTNLVDASDDLHAVLVKDMFVKANPKAFFHVAHFLFTSLDPVEFKKRFYWPLDKNTENTFRTSTVQFLNDLNHKYGLGLETITMYIVVMPGGKKFMKVLLRLIRLVMVDVIRKKQNVSSIADITLTKKRFTKSFMSDLKMQSQIWTVKSIELVNKYDQNAVKISKLNLALKQKLNFLINPAATVINSNLYSIKLNECDIKEILNRNFAEYREQTDNYQVYTTTLDKFKQTVSRKINTNSNNLVTFNVDQLRKSIELLNTFNIQSALDSSNSRIIKTKLYNLFVPNKNNINLINLYDIILFYAGQMKEQFFYYSNINVKNLQMNNTILEQYFIRLNKNSYQLTNLKGLIKNFKGETSSLNQTVIDADTNKPSKVNILSTPKIKWTTLNEMTAAMAHSNDTTMLGANNTTLLSALLSSRKLKLPNSRRKKLASADVTDNLNLDSSFELPTRRTSQNSSTGNMSGENKFAKLFEKNVKINLNSKKFETAICGTTPKLLSSNDRMFNGLLKSQNNYCITDVTVSPSGKFDTLIKIERDHCTADETMVSSRTDYTSIEQTIRNRPGSSSSFIGLSVSNIGNSSETIKPQSAGADYESDESGLSVLQTSNTTNKTPAKRTKTKNGRRNIKCDYTIVATIDLTASSEKTKPVPSPLNANRSPNENDQNQTNIAIAIRGNDNPTNLLDTSDTCLNDITL